MNIISMIESIHGEIELLKSKQMPCVRGLPVDITNVFPIESPAVTCIHRHGVCECPNGTIECGTFPEKCKLMMDKYQIKRSMPATSEDKLTSNSDNSDHLEIATSVLGDLFARKLKSYSMSLATSLGSNRMGKTSRQKNSPSRIVPYELVLLDSDNMITETVIGLSDDLSHEIIDE